MATYTQDKPINNREVHLLSNLQYELFSQTSVQQSMLFPNSKGISSIIEISRFTFNVARRCLGKGTTYINIVHLLLHILFSCSTLQLWLISIILLIPLELGNSMDCWTAVWENSSHWRLLRRWYLLECTNWKCSNCAWSSRWWNADPTCKWGDRPRCRDVNWLLNFSYSVILTELTES